MEKIQKKKISKQQRIDRILAIVALVAIVAVWFVGRSRAEAELTPFLKQAQPEAGRLEPLDHGYYAAWRDGTDGQLLGYLATGTGDGYGGELTVVVSVSSEGTVQRIVVAGHRETASFWQRVKKRDVLKSLEGKVHSDAFVLGGDVDGVSGATYTCRALVDAVRRGTRNIAREVLALPTPEEPEPEIRFGFVEGFLIFLFVAAYIGTRKWFKYKKTLRWVGMLGALLVLGFVYGNPLTMIFVNKMLLGYWPQWQLELYWYILLVGVLFFIIVDNKNLYCERVCPFGAAQECLAVIGGGKVRVPETPRKIMRWVQRVLSLGVILAALLYGSPAGVSYEVFGAFFRLIGSTFLFALLGIVLVTALFIKRPWCNYLCPLRPVTDYFRLFRNR